MRHLLTSLILIATLATPASVMAFGAPCAQARVMDDACCSAPDTRQDDDRTPWVERRCCCEIDDAPATSAQQQSAVSAAELVDGELAYRGDVVFAVAGGYADHTRVHPAARGPPPSNTLLAQSIALLL